MRRFGGCNTITLPQAGTCPGRPYVLINAAGSGSNVALAVTGGVFDDVTSSISNTRRPRRPLRLTQPPMVLAEGAFVLAAHDAQHRRNGALTRRQNRPCHQQLHVNEDAAAKQARVG